MGLGNRVRIRTFVLPAVCGRSNTEKESIREITLTPTPQTNYLVPTHGRNNHFVRIRVSVRLGLGLTLPKTSTLNSNRNPYNSLFQVALGEISGPKKSTPMQCFMQDENVACHDRAVGCFGKPQLERATRFPMPQLERATRFPMSQLELATRFPNVPSRACNSLLNRPLASSTFLGH